MPLKPLGKVKEIIEEAGMKLSYAYDDLVFLEHNAFLLQFTPRPDELLIHINSEAESETIFDEIASLQKTAERHKMFFLKGSYYCLEQTEDQTLRLQFSGHR